MIAKTTVTPTARLVEVFSAIQGEGLNVGTRQIFIRFALCDLRCHFCDSAHTWNAPATCRIERSPGLRDFEIHSNPVPLPILIEWVEQQNLPCLHDSISLTGGEPLLHAPFLTQFLPQVRDYHWSTHILRNWRTSLRTTSDDSPLFRLCGYGFQIAQC